MQQLHLRYGLGGIAVIRGRFEPKKTTMDLICVELQSEAGFERIAFLQFDQAALKHLSVGV